jgi:hypothetical protein
VRGFVSLGGNFLRAVPERSLIEPAWAGLHLSCRSRSPPSSIAATIDSNVKDNVRALLLACYARQAACFDAAPSLLISTLVFCKNPHK